MGFLGNLEYLFQSGATRERESRRMLREKQRKVERVIESMGERMRELEKQRAEIWAKALQEIKAGRKTEAARLVQQFKAYGVQIAQIDKQRIVIQSRLMNVSTVGEIGSVLGTITEMAKIRNINVEEVEDKLETLDLVYDDIGDINKTMDETHKRDAARTAVEAEKMGTEVTDQDLMAALEREAAVEIGGGSTIVNAGKETLTDTGDINDGVSRLKARIAKFEGND